ncbi:MAG: hypothetical protein DMD79_23215, partial [Candidatus Rokuibacteriota bacterium]
MALLPVVLFYYVALTVGEQMANTRRIPPWVAMWGPNIVVGGVGLYLLWSNLKERPIPVVVAVQRVAWLSADLAAAVWRRGGRRRAARRDVLRRRSVSGVARARRGGHAS